MKVRDLISQLRDADQDAEVHIAYNYGDRSQTDGLPEDRADRGSEIAE